eukprot:scaffold354171_cov27-Prasinocladus_malaysianus.AAC.1
MEDGSRLSTHDTTTRTSTYRSQHLQQPSQGTNSGTSTRTSFVLYSYSYGSTTGDRAGDRGPGTLRTVGAPHTTHHTQHTPPRIRNTQAAVGDLAGTRRNTAWRQSVRTSTAYSSTYEYTRNK